jgi:hypothetical protein
MGDLRWVSLAALVLLGASAARADEAPGQTAKDVAATPVAAQPVAAQPILNPKSGISFGLKLGNQFLSGLSAHALKTDLELGHSLDPEWVTFVQVGFTWVPHSETQDTSFGVIPGVLGIRHLYSLDRRFQPFWGFGLGVQLALNGKFGFVKSTGPLPMLLGFAGFQYMVNDTFAVGLESSTNVAQGMLGLVGDGTGGSLNFNVNGTLGWRF